MTWRARELAKEMRQLGEVQGQLPVKLMECRLSGITCFYLGELSASGAYLERGLALFDPNDRPIYATLAVQDAHVTLSTYLSHTLFCMGYLEEARSRSDEAVDEARKLSHAYTLAHALLQGCLLGWMAGSDQEFLGRVDELIALSADQQFPYNWGIGTMLRGVSVAAMGQTEQGIALINAGLSRYRATGAVHYVPLFLSLLAEVHGKGGAQEEGMRQLAEADRLVEATQERWAEAEMHRLRGAVLLSMGQYTAAEDSYRPAITVARRQNAKFWELRAALELSRLWRRQGKRQQALDLLAPVYGWITEGPALRGHGALGDKASPVTLKSDERIGNLRPCLGETIPPALHVRGRGDRALRPARNGHLGERVGDLAPLDFKLRHAPRLFGDAGVEDHAALADRRRSRHRGRQVALDQPRERPAGVDGHQADHEIDAQYR